MDTQCRPSVGLVDVFPVLYTFVPCSHHPVRRDHRDFAAAAQGRLPVPYLTFVLTYGDEVFFRLLFRVPPVTPPSPGSPSIFCVSPILTISASSRSRRCITNA